MTRRQTTRRERLDLARLEAGITDEQFATFRAAYRRLKTAQLAERAAERDRKAAQRKQALEAALTATQADMRPVEDGTVARDDAGKAP